MTTNDRERLYDDLVGLCYECVLDPSAWLRLLQQLMQASGRQQSVLLSWDQRNPGAQATTINLCDPASIAAYNEHYHLFDPCRDFVGQRQAGLWYHDFEEMGERRMARDPYYQEFSRPYGMRNISCLKLYEEDQVGAYLSLLRTPDARAPSADEQQMLARLAPHLMRAGKLIDRLNDMQLAVDQRDLLLDNHGTPLWLVDAHSRVLYANQAASQLLSQPGAPLRERFSRLSSVEQDNRLQALIRQATRRDKARRPGLLALGAARQLLVLPLTAQAQLNHELQRPLALLALSEPRTQLDLLTELFQLSPAEQRLANLLIQGLTPQECADRLDVSINTIRTQLRALLHKTDTQRQAELAGLITRLGQY